MTFTGKIIIGLAILVFLALVQLLYFRYTIRKPRPTFTVTCADIPRIVSQLRRSARDRNLATLGFVPAGKTGRDSVHLQYSISGKMVGFDWLLLGRANKTDAPKVVELAKKLDCHVTEESAPLPHLRITGDRIIELGVAITHDLYGLEPAGELLMVVRGFQWVLPDAPVHPPR